jgi:hypothetical protein
MVVGHDQTNDYTFKAEPEISCAWEFVCGTVRTAQCHIALDSVPKLSA